MCKFCNKENKNSLKSVEDICSVDVYINENFDLIIENMNLNEVFEINFCPVCGNRLRKVLIEDEVLAGGFYDGNEK